MCIYIYIKNILRDFVYVKSKRAKCLYGAGSQVEVVFERLTTRKRRGTLVSFCFLIWALGTSVCSPCENLNYTFKTFAFFVYICYTSIKSIEKIFFN